MELKKVTNHPYLFNSAENQTNGDEDTPKGLVVMSSGKIVLLDKLFARLPQDGQFFNQMGRGLDIMNDYMTVRGYQHQRLDGTVSSRGA